MKRVATVMKEERERERERERGRLEGGRERETDGERELSAKYWLKFDQIYIVNGHTTVNRSSTTREEWSDVIFITPVIELEVGKE